MELDIGPNASEQEKIEFKKANGFFEYKSRKDKIAHVMGFLKIHLE